MTVAQMIEKLKKFPPELEVLDMGLPVEDLKLVKIIPDGTPDDANQDSRSVVIVL